MDIRPGSTLDGPSGQSITVRRVIGTGGFGQVLEGESADGTLVAVKAVLTTTLSDDELRALQNEIKLAGEVNDPNVVKVLHVNDGDATAGIPPYIVMELVTGGTLRSLLEGRMLRNDPFSPTELRAMYQQLASGMRAVNAKVVHRDVKPDNVLIDGAHGALKVSDFGLAKLVNAATRSHTFKGWGTPPYMAPEAFDGTAANTIAMDVYAMGVVFHELAALDRPITPASGDLSPVGWARAHRTQVPANLRAIRSDLPEDLHQLILQMLQKHPARRPPDWSEILDRLQGGGAAAPAGATDVTKLVEKATLSYQESTAADARAREERERREERRAILELEAREPLALLRRVVEAFNAATAVGKLTHTETGLSADVTASGPQRLQLIIQIGDGDIEALPDGFVRMLGTVRLMPGPSFREAESIRYDPESFSGFNIAYWVRNAAELYGSWTQYRFEYSPLAARTGPTHWFALGLDELSRQIRLLRAAGMYQHEQRALDDVWMKDLLARIL